MLTHHTPPGSHAPLARYNHAVEVAPGARLLFCSGQLGVGPDNQVPEDLASQAALCFDNVGVILRAAGMDYRHIVRIDAFVTDRAHLADYMRVRDRYVADPAPASTLMIVAGFARKAFKVEIEVIAAAP